MNEHNELSPRQRILETVISAIESDGLGALTTRKISEQAGVNIAAINYYFRSKDLLVAEAMAATLKAMQDDVLALLAQPDMAFTDILQAALRYLIEGGLRYPGILRAHLQGVLIEQRQDAPVLTAFREIVQRLAARAAVDYPTASPERIELALTQVFAALFFMLLSPGELRLAALVDITQPHWVERLPGEFTRLFVAGLEQE